MRLCRYRVTNFRSVTDSEWIDADQVTAMIGVNESGKSNLLLPLWKLNPAREGDLKATSDYPKSNYVAIRSNPEQFCFITAEFDCSEHAAELAGMTGVAAEHLKLVQVKRWFDERYTVSFPEYQHETALPMSAVAHIVRDTKRELETLTSLAKEEALKPKLLAALDTIDVSNSDGTWTAIQIEELVAQLETALPEAPASTSTIVPRFKQMLEELKEKAAVMSSALPGDIDGVLDFIVNRLPKFVYYSNYGNLDSEIYLPHVVENLERKDLGARESAKARTLKVLFSFVKLNPKEILELGRDFKDPNGRTPSEADIESIATKKRDRTIMLHSAGTDLTKKFRDWWKQGDYTIEFQADGDHFRIWVSDSKRPEKVELEDRSAGLQWFLSFYMIFLVESRGEHSKAVLLLDEPGLSLHPLAQRDLSAFFESLSTSNQLIYTTHSPFLVDADSLDRARKVYVGADGSTKASADLRRGSDDPRKNGATYAVHSALNMNVAESLLLGCHPVIVEGPSDQHYLNAIKNILIGGGQIKPKREIVFPPSHGANNAKVVASILTGRDEVLPVMLFDGDDAGKRMAKDMKNGFYQNAKEKVLCTDTYSGLTSSEVEDLFPQDFIADIVDRIERRPETRFADVVVQGTPIVPQIEKWAASQEIVLQQGWKVELARETKKRLTTLDLAKLDSSYVERWKMLFDAFALA